MSIWEKAKGKVEELVGRAEEVYGQSHGDAAAQLDGEAHRLEGEAEVEAAERAAAVEDTRRDDGTSRAH
jgi:uncharacterized protein YjbJ (UPF0337 family)